MAEIKLTKNELKTQMNKLQQLERYLPTLQLKKALLQLEVASMREELQGVSAEYAFVRTEAEKFMKMLVNFPLDLSSVAKPVKVETGKDNIAGVEVPVFLGVVFEKVVYRLEETPIWTEKVIEKLRELVTGRVKIEVVEARKRALEDEAREVAKRVNLFEKVLIPRARENIKKIRVYLSDMQLAQVSRAKAAKRLIEAKCA